MKYCRVCKTDKHFSEFYNSKATLDGKSYRCKSCDKVARQAYHKAHPERVKTKHRNNRRRWAYGLEPSAFESLLSSQNGQCAICNVLLDQSFGRHHKPNKLVVDHCHSTGKVRGLLCTMCNKGIGLLKDDPALIESALLYLKSNTYADIH
jgi:hypothetical protein